MSTWIHWSSPVASAKRANPRIHPPRVKWPDSDLRPKRAMKRAPRRRVMIRRIRPVRELDYASLQGSSRLSQRMKLRNKDRSIGRLFNEIPAFESDVAGGRGRVAERARGR